jgi:multimeric flavodoxin WrbA
MDKDHVVLGLSGSPRKGGTDHAVRYALQRLEERHGLTTRYFSVRGKTIQFCIHCDYCIRKKKGCIHQDDLQELYPLLEEAAIWILGSPVYHGHISAQLKAVLDRTRALLATRPGALSGKLGAGIAVGGDRNGGQEQVLGTIADFYLINEMIPVAGGAFGANWGGSVWTADRGSEGAAEDEEGLRSIRRTVDRLARATGLTRS